MHAVGRDRHRRVIAQPDMAVEAGALIPPALHRIRIDADGDDIRLVPEARKWRQVDAHGVIAGEIVRNDAAIDPDGREGCDATEFQLDPPATKRGVQPEAAPVPADPARAIALRDIGGLHEGLERGPVMRQVDGLPVAIVEIDRRRTTGVAGLDRQIGRIVRVKRGGLDIALMEQPAAIHQDACGVLHRQSGGKPIGRGRHGKRAGTIRRAAIGGEERDGRNPAHQPHHRAAQQQVPTRNRHAAIRVSTGLRRASSTTQSARRPATSAPRSWARPRNAAGWVAAIAAA